MGRRGDNLRSGDREENRKNCAGVSPAIAASKPAHSAPESPRGHFLSERHPGALVAAHAPPPSLLLGYTCWSSRRTSLGPAELHCRTWGDSQRLQGLHPCVAMAVTDRCRAVRAWFPAWKLGRLCRGVNTPEHPPLRIRLRQGFPLDSPFCLASHTPFPTEKFPHKPLTHRSSSWSVYFWTSKTPF